MRSDFWGLTPKTIQIDFEAYNRRQKKEAQARWELGAWFKNALNSSVLVATLAEKNTARKMPHYPEMPFKDDLKAQSDEPMTDEQLKAERLKAYIFFKNLGKR